MASPLAKVHDWIPPRTPELAKALPNPLLRWGAYMTKPTTLPRWAILLSHGALIATVIAGAISYGRSAKATEDALARVREVPALQANMTATSQQMAEVKELLQKTLDSQNKRIDATQQAQVAQTAAITSLADKLTTVQGQMGSVWALAQADSNKVSKLEGMLTAMQNQLQQQHKEK